MITTAKQENELAMKTFHETDRTNKLTIQTLQEQVHDHIQELENLRNLHSIRIDEKNMKERELQQIILSKDDRLREV